MALQVWLPLNGDLHNQGLSNVTVTNNGAIIDDNGKIGKCYKFNPDNSSSGQKYLMLNKNLSDILPTNGKSFSFACWIKITGNLYSNGCGLISANQYNATGIGLYINNSTKKIHIHMCYNGTEQEWTATKMAAIQNNVWYHVTYTYNEIGRQMTIYINGVNVDSTTANNVWVTRNEKISIGRGSQGGWGYTLPGFMNDVRIYDHCLSPKEVKELSRGLVLHYKLDNLLNNKIYDCSGYLNNGTITGALNINNDSPRYNYSTRFNGSSNKIMVPFNYQYYGNNFTICAWVKSNVNNGGYLTAIGNELSNGGIVFGELGATNKMNCYLNATNGQDICVCSYNSFEANKWYHVIYSVSNALTSPTTILYINGVQISTNTSSSAFGEPDQPIYIGCNGNYRYWNGQISDFRIYTTTLSADDIRELYDTAGSIDNQGDILGFEFDEEEIDKGQILKTGIIKINNFIEVNDCIYLPTGTWIDTGLNYNNSDICKAETIIKYESGGTGRDLMGYSATGGGYWGVTASGSWEPHGTFTYTNSDITKKNTIVYIFSSASEHGTYRVGALGSSYSVRGKYIYRVRLYKNNILERDLYPIQIDNKVGLFDLLHNEYYLANNTNGILKNDDIIEASIFKNKVESNQLLEI